MEKVTSIEQGVAQYFKLGGLGEAKEYKLIKRKNGEFTDFIEFDGKKYPVFSWRSEPQTASVAGSAKNRMGDSCSFKISGAVPKDFGLDRFIYRELDVAEWTLDSKIKHLTAFVNNNAANIIVRMENDKVAVLELAASLPAGAAEQVRHTAWGTVGMASDRVVSNKIRPQGVYYYNDVDPIPATFNDDLYYMYGLNQDDTAEAVCVVQMLLGAFSGEEFLKKDEDLKKYVKAVYLSAETGERVAF